MNYDSQLGICHTFIHKEYARLNDELFEFPSDTETQEPEENRFNFKDVKQHIETLPDAKAKLTYLLEVKTEYEQTLSKFAFGWDLGGEPSFAEKCELEIQKLKQLMALEKPIRKQLDPQPENQVIKRNSDFTTARQVLAVHYLLNHLGVYQNTDKTDVARFIEFLTGKNFDSIYKKVREPIKLKDSEAKKDLKFVKSYFQKLSLTQIVKAIDDEMNT